MINKEKVFIVSSNVDDSIKGTSLYSDVRVFKTFKQFEEYVDTTPIDASMIIINSKDLQFTNNSMNRLVNILNSTFVSIDRFIYYMVDDLEVKDKVDELCKRNGYDKIKCIYSDTLHSEDVAYVLTGEALSSKDTVTEVKTYRIRASDYVRSQRDKEGLDYEDIYYGDEDELSGIADEEVPEDLKAMDSTKAIKHIICSNEVRERSAWAILKAQYLSMQGKVLLLEKDIEYHTALDMLSKLNIDMEFIDVVDIYRDCSSVINRIKLSKSKLVFVGSKSKLNYNYDVLINVLMSNLEDFIDYYIYETELNQIPYGSKVDIIMPTTVPEIFKSVSSMSSISSFKDVLIIGLDITNFGVVGLSEREFRTLLQELFQENDISSYVIKLQGLLLRKEIGLGGIFMHN